MRRSLALVLLLLLVLDACRTAPSAPKVVIDCRAGASSAPCDLASFVRAVQHASGRSFTWTKETDARLASTRFDGPEHVEVPANELDAWLATTFERYGLALTPIGPKRLNVWLVAERG